VVKIIDTTTRDGQQSLIATRMTTEDILAILETMDEIGFYAMEVWGGATFDACLRYLNEDPWERIRRIKSGLKKTKTAMLLRGQNLVGYKNYPDDVVEKFVEKAFANGVDLFRIFDALNDVRNLRVAVKTAKRVGAEVHGDVVYTISPVHTLEHYLSVAREIAALEVDAIRIKDMAGLLSPTMAYDLVKGIREETGLPVAVHSHSTCGLCPLNYMKALEAGAEYIDTAISGFAFGTSQPAVESLLVALKGSKFELKLNEEALAKASAYFRRLREKYRKYASEYTDRIDPEVVFHQIPGGMMSNLVAQLKEYNALDKLGEVLKEVYEVRKDLGYPPLVTPLSQIVGTQAVVNVMAGKRYEIVIRELEDYVKGLYGRPPAPIDEKLVKRVLGDSKPIDVRPADLLEPVLDKIPDEVKALARKEEDLLSYALFPQQALAFLRGEAKKEVEVLQAPKVEAEAKPSVNPTSVSATTATITAKARKLRVMIGDEVFEIIFEET